MKRKQFLKGSAIVGLSLASPQLLKGSSGLFSEKSERKVYRVLNASRTKVGTLPILRAFAGDHIDHVSPYVMFDEFGPVELSPGSNPLRVDAHPHAGIIPTTYFLSGSGHHKDSLNYDFQVSKGEFMMFNSGKGALHMEETGQQLFDNGGIYHGFQIWLNTLAKDKFINPSTHVFSPEKMGSLTEENFSAKVILGELFGVKSQIELLSPAFYYYLELNANCSLEVPVESNHNAFIYVIDGEIEVEGQRGIKTNQVVLYERGGDAIRIFAKDPAKILLLGGQPLNEPVFAYGPFVMNTEEQIMQCIADYRAGKMGNPEIVNQ